jgi:hypothetical protein
VVLFYDYYNADPYFLARCNSLEEAQAFANEWGQDKDIYGRPLGRVLPEEESAR